MSETETIIAEIAKLQREVVRNEKTVAAIRQILDGMEALVAALSS